MDSTPRQYPRFKAALPVELRLVGTQIPLRGLTGDISRGGLYIEMSFTQPISTKVEINLWEGTTKIRAKGVVVSNHPSFGNGVMFTEMSEEDSKALRKLLESIDPKMWRRRMSAVAS